eukprot:CAMPEP_0203791498 /NCGR_PEP_ID=MMETSP0100_2-20121128/4669_1 /ASSEMBLY_ACC=CAM_ASM_000210 /TAXON_ID=96639 /ORGANISM=" , Strain NY0313808BC1" /LENGTH=73 /DNA_ID=CAMNT_0050694825 /DNA_START=226 /DNA_END=445 /DNA_ORIENTATION=+
MVQVQMEVDTDSEPIQTRRPLYGQDPTNAKVVGAAYMDTVIHRLFWRRPDERRKSNAKMKKEYAEFYLAEVDW